MLEAVVRAANERLSRRGPDHHGVLRFDYASPQRLEMDHTASLPSNSTSYLEFHGHLLAMRGFLPQPLISKSADLAIDRTIVWNGETFRAPFLKTVECLKTDTEASISDISDTEMVFKLLDTLPVLDALNQVEGPWAIVYYSHASENSVYFGRDPRGRRSLMFGQVGDFIIISSIPWRHPDLPIQWIEVDTKGIYQLNLDTCQLSLHSWPQSTAQIAQRLQVVPLDGAKLSDDIILQELTDVLRLSIRRRVHFRGDHVQLNQVHLQVVSPSASSSDISNPMNQSAPVAVLFSGGLDSTVLAALVDAELPNGVPIDLINVAFGNDQQTSAAPDRVSGLQSYEDLKRMAPLRPWRLVLVNVARAELEAYTPEVASLMYPNNTLMDISISAPLWFASRGTGVLASTDSEERVAFQSTAKVLLVGAGADEQFAGYGRHRVSYRRGGWTGLQEELDKDIKRLWKRNLGRDDRVLSDHGKEARFPFLDADVMHWISSHYLSDLCDMNLPPGEGDKRALRLVARKLGLNIAGLLPKRAIQFGTKITKQMPKGKGTDNFEA